MAPPVEGDEYPDFLHTGEMWQIAEHLDHCMHSSYFVRHVEAKEEENAEEEPPHVEERRKKIHEDYDGTALGSEPPIDPPRERPIWVCKYNAQARRSSHP